jgi:HPt (histidine-containing phosphotransfer) domain-containing protein
MDDYVAKPIDPDALASVLDRWAPAARGTDGAGTDHLALVHDGGHIDAGQIEGLAELRTADGSSLLATFISSFTRRADNRLDTIRDCADRADDEALAMAAHELKGSAATIGAVRVAALCAELEHGGSRVLRMRPHVLEDLAAELELAVQELDVIAGRAA